MSELERKRHDISRLTLLDEGTKRNVEMYMNGMHGSDDSSSMDIYMYRFV